MHPVGGSKKKKEKREEEREEEEEEEENKSKEEEEGQKEEEGEKTMKKKEKSGKKTEDAKTIRVEFCVFALAIHCLCVSSFSLHLIKVSSGSSSFFHEFLSTPATMKQDITAQPAAPGQQSRLGGGQRAAPLPARQQQQQQQPCGQFAPLANGQNPTAAPPSSAHPSSPRLLLFDHGGSFPKFLILLLPLLLLFLFVVVVIIFFCNRHCPTTQHADAHVAGGGVPRARVRRAVHGRSCHCLCRTPHGLSLPLSSITHSFIHSSIHSFIHSLFFLFQGEHALGDAGRVFVPAGSGPFGATAARLRPPLASMGGQPALLLRPGMLRAAQQLRGAPPPPRMLLVGAAGTGKTATMGYLAQACFEAGWIVALVPDGGVAIALYFSSFIYFYFFFFPPLVLVCCSHPVEPSHGRH